MKRLYCLLIVCMITVMLVAQTETAKNSQVDYMESVSKVQINQYSPAETLYHKGQRWFFRKEPIELAYLIASAEKGYAKAQSMLGKIFASKDAKELNIYDEELSKKWYSKAHEGFMKLVEEGNLNAMEEMGHLYRVGNLLYAKDTVLAEKYYRMGAEKGSAGCQLWLGQFLREKGLKEEAFAWLLKSGEKGQGWSAFIVGQMYENGEGTPKDMSKAIEWYTKSAKSENLHAKEARQALERLGQPVPEISRPHIHSRKYRQKRKASKKTWTGSSFT